MPGYPPTKIHTDALIFVWLIDTIPCDKYFVFAGTTTPEKGPLYE